MRTPRDPRRKLGPAAVLTEQQIRAILQTFGPGPSGVRNRSLVLVLWRTGIRLGEALALAPRDVDLASSTSWLTVRSGKGGRSRRLAVHQEAALALELWLARRAELFRAHGLAFKAPYAPLFCTITTGGVGGELGQQYVREMLNERAKRAGLDVRVHPHAFRATLAVELAGEGRPLPVIRDVLGHRSVGTTDAYLRRVAPAELELALTDR